MAANRSLKNVEMKIVRIKPVVFGLNNLFRTKNIIQGINTPTIPMLNTFAPSAIMPPSANRNACRTKIIDIDIRPANGPKMSPIVAPPRRCAVVPPITGIFINIAVKKSAVSRPIMGTCCSVSLIFLKEIAQNTMVIRKAGIAIIGGRKPSGMCMFLNLQE
jgi:hypothetical protein